LVFYAQADMTDPLAAPEQRGVEDFWWGRPDVRFERGHCYTKVAPKRANGRLYDQCSRCESWGHVSEMCRAGSGKYGGCKQRVAVSYTHLRAHETLS
jgi:hypothetical protein